MLIVIAAALLGLALVAMIAAWGKEIDTEVAGRIDSARPPVRRVA